MADAIILTNEQINHKIKRISFQILEENVNENEIIIAGIAANGFILAKKIKEILEEISSASIVLCEVIIDKKNPLNAIKTSLKSEDYKGKPLVLVDDVLNSGTTLIYGIKHFLDVPLKSFKTAVLVNRNHKKYPVKADYKGISLSTTLQDNITVEFNGEEALAYLD
ncbi:phosphoribosyltransferase family protein [Urechidicola vernalis]|uniref:Phosphoribosyltransferase family protein n=1 Tax=Urechidicola vernalis TaxID=3075600 RepID=A0ABU2Y0M1_9FLAO|nr:phosphoribosyltransferase family protein [Urechidicola sp. P050]MDT0551707.1 phosphoribosyltransferase family protein [Urechidicola sp. P050]